MPDQSEVTVKVQEQFAGQTANNDATLTTKAVAGQIVVLPDGKVQEGSKLTVGLDSLTSDRTQRDRFIKGNTLETSRFPNAEFTPTELRGLPNPLPTSGDFTGQIVGTMRIHDTTKPVTFDVKGRVDGGTVKGTASTKLKITDFGMSLPRVPVIASIEDLARLDVNFTATS